MSRVAAWLWLAVVLVAVVYLIRLVETSMTFRTDLMALLPAREQDTAAQRAQDLVTKALSRQLMLLVGHQDRAAAREAAGTLGGVLTGSKLVKRSDTDIDADRIRRIGAFYAPYRAGLLSDTDRDLLRAGRGSALATRALSQVFGFVGLGDAAILRDDPFLLLPSFFAGLPLPMSRLAPDEGMLSVVQDNKTWVLVAGHLTQEPYALDVQRRLSAVLDPAIESLHAQYPDLEVLRHGAVFFARAGAEEAMSETSLIGIVSTIGIIVVLLTAFRALGPVWLSLLVIAVGVMTALAGSLLVFGELHVGALLFGVSLIGVAVDYSLQYCSETFTAETSARDRLRRVRLGDHARHRNDGNRLFDAVAGAVSGAASGSGVLRHWAGGGVADSRSVVAGPGPRRPRPTRRLDAAAVLPVPLAVAVEAAGRQAKRRSGRRGFPSWDRPHSVPYR